MKKVSVIVPVYNAQNTLAACLGNLVHQTLDDIEIILVNDASTDDSCHIISDCKNQFPERVIVINSPQNLGTGGARNLALDAARGEYISFVDSDDMVDSTMYEKMYAAAKDGDHDFVDCAFLDIRRDIALCTSGEECVGVLDDKKRSELVFMQGFLSACRE